MARGVFFGLGCLMLTLGFVGVVVPLMPTTIFIILAAWFFARSSPRLEAWLLGHPRFGPGLRAWRETGAVPRHAKIAACMGMTAGYGLFWLHVRPNLGLAVAVAAGMLATAIWILRRPTPEDQE